MVPGRGAVGDVTSHYFATFRRRAGQQFRMDTRIYLQARATGDEPGPCIGCIIGKNPGSAQPVAGSRRAAPIRLGGDRFLPNVRAIVSAGYRCAAMQPPPGAYLRVLNLFYLCDRDLGSAKARFSEVPSPLRCPTEQEPYPWAWYAWGGGDRFLDPLKQRFGKLRCDTHFFYDNRRGAVIERAPGVADRARHTQGMPHAPLVAFLGALLA